MGKERVDTDGREVGGRERGFKKNQTVVCALVYSLRRIYTSCTANILKEKALL